MQHRLRLLLAWIWAIGYPGLAFAYFPPTTLGFALRTALLMTALYPLVRVLGWFSDQRFVLFGAVMVIGSTLLHLVQPMLPQMVVRYSVLGILIASAVGVLLGMRTERRVG